MKIEFFMHGDLYDAEAAEDLPLRLGFAGLWCMADREGRFEWKPRELKLYILPYDDVDFSRVLDALATRGFIVKYTTAGRDYGWIPGFGRHQVVNNREEPSRLPAPPADVVTAHQHGTLTRAPRVEDATRTRQPREGHATRKPPRGTGTGTGTGTGREERSETTGGGSNGRSETWITPALQSWAKRNGGVEPPHGSYVTVFSKIRKESGHSLDRIFRAWEDYLTVSWGQRWCSPANFQTHYAEHDPDIIAVGENGQLTPEGERLLKALGARP